MCTCSYIKALLGGPTPAEYDTLKQETDDLRQQLESAKKEIEDLKASLVTVQCRSCYCPCVHRAYMLTDAVHLQNAAAAATAEDDS